MRLAFVGALVCAVVFGSGDAAADTTVGIGLYTPTAPFAGPAERLEYVSGIATQIGPGYVGRVYARAADFSAAAKRGEIAFAIVDAAYLAALGVPYTVLASAERGGAPQVSWEVIAATPTTTLLGLAGKTIAVPTIGARDEAFVYEVLLEGELPKDFFAKVTFAPDALSALAAVERGRADAAIVPAGLTPPSGARRVATLRPVSWPVLIALSSTTSVDAVTAALGRLGGPVLEHFTAGGGAAITALAGRFGRAEHRPPLIVPTLRLGVTRLLAERTFALPRAAAVQFLSEPSAKPTGGR